MKKMNTKIIILLLLSIVNLSFAVKTYVCYCTDKGSIRHSYPTYKCGKKFKDEGASIMYDGNKKQWHGLGLKTWMGPFEQCCKDSHKDPNCRVDL